MSETKHTPGPWTIEYKSRGLRHIRSSEQFIGTLHAAEADALLIAAAPELYGALKEAEAAFEYIEHVLTFGNAERVDKARAVIRGAIAKAEGQGASRE